MIYTLICLVLLFPLTSTLTFGIDNNNLISIIQFKCLLTENQTFALIRAWRSFGVFDTNSPQTLKNAILAGYKKSDLGVYIFPCYSTNVDKSPEAQVMQMIQKLGDAPYGSIWIDMETNPSPNCGWSQNYAQNCAFTQKLVQTARKYNIQVGIYASLFMWNQIMNGTDECPSFSDLPLWYPHYNGILNFNDFKYFGGWSKPTMKQYIGTSTLCGIEGLGLNIQA